MKNKDNPAKPFAVKNGPNNKDDAGFSVLEAIMAVAILSIALMPLMNMQSQFVKTVETYERVQRRVALEQQILERMKAVDLGRAPEGEERFGTYILTWSLSQSALESANGNKALSNNNDFARYKVYEMVDDRFTYSLRPVAVKLIDAKGNRVLEKTHYKFSYVANFSFLDSVY